MKSRQRDVRVGMLGLQLDGLLQRVLDLGAKTLCQRFGDADALAVATQSVGLPVVSVGVFGIGLLLCLGLSRDVHEHLQLGFFFGLKVVGVNAGGLVGDREAP